MIKPTPTPEPLRIELLCKHCGTYLWAGWQRYDKGVEIVVDTWPHCCVPDTDWSDK